VKRWEFLEKGDMVVDPTGRVGTVVYGPVKENWLFTKIPTGRATYYVEFSREATDLRGIRRAKKAREKGKWVTGEVWKSQELRRLSRELQQMADKLQRMAGESDDYPYGRGA